MSMPILEALYHQAEVRPGTLALRFLQPRPPGA